ncbi:MAG: hypothetical protein LBG96_08510 [Tannerella sp.]|nr:hypothetical protein [Tannerella sp.]
MNKIKFLFKTNQLFKEGQIPALKVTFDSGILFVTNSSTVSDASKSALRVEIMIMANEKMLQDAQKEAGEN